MPSRILRIAKQTRVIAARGTLSVFWPDTPESGERMQQFREQLQAIGFMIESEENDGSDDGNDQSAPRGARGTSEGTDKARGERK